MGEAAGADTNIYFEKPATSCGARGASVRPRPEATSSRGICGLRGSGLGHCPVRGRAGTGRVHGALTRSDRASSFLTFPVTFGNAPDQTSHADSHMATVTDSLTSARQGEGRDAEACRDPASAGEPTLEECLRARVIVSFQMLIS